MAKIRSKDIAQLRGFAKIYCPVHGHSKVPMLPPVSCAGCEMERGRGDLLRRSKRKERRWKLKQRDIERLLEEDEQGTGESFKREIYRHL